MLSHLWDGTSMLFTCKAWLTNRVRRSDVRNLDASDHLFLDDLLYISNVKMSKSSMPE